MNVKVESLEKNVVQLKIEVDNVRFEEGMKKSYIKNAKKFNIPGFRVGKAPRNMIERYYGEEVFYEDAVNAICPEIYDEAVEEMKILPVDLPKIDIVQIGGGQPLIFTAKVTVKPEVVLGDYKGIEVNNIENNVTEEDVEERLNQIADNNARLITVEDRAARNGDLVFINFEGFVDSESFEGGRAQNYKLEIGSGQFIQGFEEQLIGAKAGETIEVHVTFPEDYFKSELSGKEAVFDVTINEIKVKELPQIDDEFAKDVSEFDILNEFKEDIMNKLKEETKNNTEIQLKNDMIMKIIENSTIDIPDVMIEKYIDRLILDFQMNLEHQGLDLEKYLQLVGANQNEFRNSYCDRAEIEVKTQLVLEKIAEVEYIEITDEEKSKELERLAGIYKQDVDLLKKNLGKDTLDYINSGLLIDKTTNFLFETVKLIQLLEEK